MGINWCRKRRRRVVAMMRSSGSRYASARVPRMDIGVRLKSNGPLRASYADMAALSRNVRRRLSVSCIWGRKRSQSWIGQFTSSVAKAANMWYFAALTAVSAAFTRWLCGSTSWMSVSWLRRNALIALEHSLSRTWSRGWIPCSQRYAYSSWNVLTMLSSFRAASGRRRMAFFE